jgi:CheY-like chemotaxis protein
MSQPKLLIVEDDDAIRLQLRYALRDKYDLSFADSRAKALGVVAEFQPDIVSLDLGYRPIPTPRRRDFVRSRRSFGPRRRHESSS